MKKTILALSILAISSTGFAADGHNHNGGQDEHALTTTFDYRGKPATGATISINSQLTDTLNFNDRTAFEDTSVNLIARFDDNTAKFADAHANLVDVDNPDTVNPSL